MTNPIDLTIIPAQPGFFVIYLSENEERAPVLSFQMHPVVAWRIETHRGRGRSLNGEIWSNADPITPAGEVANDFMILRPDGCVEHPGNTTYQTLTEALTDYRKGGT